MNKYYKMINNGKFYKDNNIYTCNKGLLNFNCIQIELNKNYKLNIKMNTKDNTLTSEILKISYKNDKISRIQVISKNFIPNKKIQRKFNNFVYGIDFNILKDILKTI